MKVITKSQKETISFGKKFAKTITGGEVVLLIGDLGAGKTTFVKGVALGLGVKNTITSPTFVLMKVYKNIKINKNIKILVHIDAYRGLDLADLENIGALEYFGENDTICFVEWGGALEEYCIKEKINYKKILIKNINQETREFIY
jgi:tRNA threonylcarbamoyladenosine biosynthesis protein TsaE